MATAARSQRVGRGRQVAVLLGAWCLTAVAAITSACAPPPPVCPQPVRLLQQEMFVRDGGTWDDGARWAFGWHWSRPENCTDPTGPTDPTDPEEPTPVVPEAPFAVLLPLGAMVVGGGALVWKRRRPGPV